MGFLKPGVLVRDLRVEAGLRQEDVARRLAKPQSWVSKTERGIRPLRVDELPLLCKALGITPTAFVALLFRPRRG